MSTDFSLFGRGDQSRVVVAGVKDQERWEEKGWMVSDVLEQRLVFALLNAANW